MIDKIYIKDFAIIRELDLPLMNGFTVITGETGAGKSLIVKALSIALGSKVDKTDVRSNQRERLLRSPIQATRCIEELFPRLVVLNLLSTKSHTMKVLSDPLFLCWRIFTVKTISSLL